MALPAVRITASPNPVAAAAPTSLSKNKPAPMIGESPTRPCIFQAAPLVVQPPEILPSSSMTNIDIVSWFSILMTGLYLDSSIHFFQSASDSAVNKFSSLKPSDKANWSAPSPDNITCGVFWRTFFATEIGCFMPCKKDTAPQSLL